MKHSTSFMVLPRHTNDMSPLIFGGKFMSELDLCAAVLSNMFVKKSNKVNNAVTYKANFEFHGPSYCGDVIYMDASIVDLGRKSIVMEVRAYREPKNEEKRYHVATANFVFVTRLNDTYVEHGMKLDEI